VPHLSNGHQMVLPRGRAAWPQTGRRLRCIEHACGTRVGFSLLRHVVDI
jgi:hypothetical protein